MLRLISFILLLPAFAWAYPNDLEQVYLRKSRMETQYSSGVSQYLEDSSNNYIWNSESLCYTDQIFGTEVWRIVGQNNGYDIFHDITWPQFNANGSRIAVESKRDCGIVECSYEMDYGNLMFVNTTGAYLRPARSMPSVTATHSIYVHWNPVDPDVLFQMGRDYGSCNVDGVGYNDNDLYKVTVSATTETKSLLLSLENATAEVNLKKCISGDGTKMLPSSSEPDGRHQWPLTVYPYSGATIDVPNGWAMFGSSTHNIRNMDEHWGRIKTGTSTLQGDNFTGPNENGEYEHTWDESADGNVWRPYNCYIAGVTEATEATAGSLEADEWDWDYSGDTVYIGWDPSGSTVVIEAPAIYAMHDNFLEGSGATIWYYYMPESTNGTWLRCTISGTSDDGGPWHTSDQESPFDWGGENEPVNTVATYGFYDPWDNDRYFSHPAWDRWGRFVAFSNTQGAYASTGFWDSKEHTYDNSAKILDQDDNSDYNGASHNDWHAWSDWALTSCGPSGYPADILRISKYSDSSSAQLLAKAYHYTSGIYAAAVRPSQSPDGTKAVFHSCHHNRNDPDDDDEIYPDIFYAVAYYPYPPEITSTISSLNTSYVTFDYRIGQANERTYTTRGWPDEDTDDPAPPREIKEFVLWRSSDGSNWTVAGTTSYNIFDKYNFSTGVWTGTSTFQIIEPGVENGTYYYAVTAREWSGLESRTLSNIHEITVTGGGDDVGSGEGHSYPSSPGGKSNFYTTAPSAPSNVRSVHSGSGRYTITWDEPGVTSYIRYYNIYASDGALAARQTNRIFSVAKEADYDLDGSYSQIDWLGNTNGKTKYGVTSVDYQGNESSIVTDQHYHTISYDSGGITLRGGSGGLSVN